MPLVYACIAPHGSEAIEQLAPKRTSKKFQKARDGLRRLAKEIGRSKPDTIIVATPHNLKLWKNIGVVLAENSTGTLQASPRSKVSVGVRVRCDVRLAKELIGVASRRRLPVVGANYGTSEGSLSDMPMDWGTLVPLWFILQRCRKKPKLVIVTPSREIPLTKNFQFGRVIAAQAETNRGKRIAFVASADQAHAHRKNGPYGFSRRAKEYDQAVLHAITQNRLKSIMNFKPALVEAAKPDSLWQMVILAGIMDGIKLKAEFVSYDVPTYFGMICASFYRVL